MQTAVCVCLLSTAQVFHHVLRGEGGRGVEGGRKGGEGEKEGGREVKSDAFKLT